MHGSGGETTKRTPESPRFLGPDELFLESVLQARESSVGTKILCGVELFDLACEFSKAGIRMQYPEADEPLVLDLLRQRLDLARRLEHAP